MPPRRPARFIRPAARPTPAGSPFDVWRYIEELRKLYAQLTDGIALVKSALAQFKQIKQGPKGDKGAPGTNGRNGTNVTMVMVEVAVRKFLRQPADGKSPTAELIAEAMLKSKNFKKALRSMTPNAITIETKNGESVDTDMLVASVLDALHTMGVPIDMLPKLEQRFNELGNHIRSKSEWRGGGDTVVAGAGVTITNTANGNKQISATGGVGSWQTPVEVPDGVITTFTVGATAPTDVNADGTMFFLNAGYTLVGNQLTFTNPPTQYVRYR